MIGKDGEKITNDNGFELYKEYVYGEKELLDCGFDESLQLIEDIEMQENYISILVRARSKPQILQQLSVIGISKDFLFPELEHCAESIKTKYLSLQRAEKDWKSSTKRKDALDKFDKFLNDEYH